MATHVSPHASIPPSSKALNVALWTAQILLAIPFLLIGGMKVFTPAVELAAKLGPLADSVGLVRFIGVSELAGAIGVILPAATRVAPKLTPAAAVGLATIMVLAIGYHLQHNEASHIGLPIVLLGLAAFVAWGRSTRAPIAPR